MNIYFNNNLYQLSESHLGIVEQSLGSRQAVVRQLSDSCGAVVRQSLSIFNLKLLDVSYCENLENTTFHRVLCSMLPMCHVVTSINGS